VGAKADIRAIIGELAAEGAALMVISSDIDEIMSLGDRYLVMHRGRLVKELGARASKEELMAAAAGV
jgi:ABC-type sugar transport system ATPase subunit